MFGFVFFDLGHAFSSALVLSLITPVKASVREIRFSDLGGSGAWRQPERMLDKTSLKVTLCMSLLVYNHRI